MAYHFRPTPFRIFLACVALASSTPSAAKNPHSPAFSEKDAKLQRLFRSAASPGGAYLVRYRAVGNTTTHGYGSLDCAGRLPMRTDALFESGSLTKLFTAAAIYKLSEERRLNLDDTIGELFRGVPTDKRPITVRQILAHRSGIANLVGVNGRVLHQREWTPEGYDYAPLAKAELLRRAWMAPLQFAPGTAEGYSNTGYSVLAAIVERASGTSYEGYVRKRILLPLGMVDTAYVPRSVTVRPIVQQCGKRGSTWGDPFTRGLYKSGVSWNLMGNGGMMTTLDDLDRWSAALEDGKLFRPALQRLFNETLFSPDTRCRTEVGAVGGSNGMARSLILHLPRRREVLISVGTRADFRPPREEDLAAILCPS